MGGGEMKFAYFDVDDTLVMWHLPVTDNAMAFSNPDDPSDVWMLEPNWSTIAMLKEHKRRGDKVVVWSQGGYDWAEEVVKTLKLEEYVDYCLSKPHIYYDDIPATNFMKEWVKI
jgi:phosphoserine phosphatase